MRGDGRGMESQGNLLDKLSGEVSVWIIKQKKINNKELEHYMRS